MINSKMNSIKISGAEWCRLMGHHWRKIGGVLCCTNCWEEAPHGKAEKAGQDQESLQVFGEVGQSSPSVTGTHTGDAS